jgi:hypothetical protein
MANWVVGNETLAKESFPIPTVSGDTAMWKDSSTACRRNNSLASALRWDRQGLSDESQFRRSISNQFGPIKMIRILNRETLSENEVILRLMMEGEKGGTGTVGKKVQRIGNE